MIGIPILTYFYFSEDQFQVKSSSRLTRKSKFYTSWPKLIQYILSTCVSALSWPSGTWSKTCSNGIEIFLLNSLLKEDILILRQALYHTTITISNSPGNLCVIWPDWRLTFACNKYLHFQFPKIRRLVIRYHKYINKSCWLIFIN